MSLALSPVGHAAPAVSTAPAPARPYDVLAPVYELLTGDYAYDDWVRSLVELALGHGLEGGRALDAACGNGNATLPLLDLGYDVSGCDISPAMVAAARARTGGRARIVEADLCRMPLLGRFDLATCFGDVPNHLASLEQVRLALRGLRRNLRRGGMLLFDVNLLAAYRDVPDVVVRDDTRTVTWWGGRAEIREPGGAGEMFVEVCERVGGRWKRDVCRQPHRHHPLPHVLAAAADAGLEVLAVRGYLPGEGFSSFADEDVHTKAAVLARRPSAPPSTATRRA
jgi:SAM-dependent methyltransferase